MDMQEDQNVSSNKHLRVILDTIVNAVIVTDQNLTVTVVNTQVESLLGIKSSDFIGQQIMDVLPLEWFSQMDENEYNLDQWELEVLYERKHDNRKIPILISSSILRNPTQDFNGLVVIITDLSRRKSLERQLLQSQKLESVGQLAAGIAHEINTPIQYVRDNTSFLDEQFRSLSKLLSAFQTFKEQCVEPQHQEAKKELDQIIEKIDLDYLLSEIPLAIQQTLQGAESVAKIVRSMKEFSHPGTESKSKVDINAALESTLTVSKNEWKYVAETKLELSENLPLVNCYPGEINQVFLNIIVNGAHAIAEKIKNGIYKRGEIVVATKCVDNGVEISLSDNGTGIPEEIRQYVYDPFFTTKEVGRGTGQGLAIVHNTVVERHQGKISFETVVGQGTKFTLFLPFD